MILALTLSLLAAPTPCPAPFSAAGPAQPAAPGARAGQDAALDSKIAAAGKDVAKLLELAAACSAAKQEADAAKVYKRVLELDSANETARKALRHQLYDGKWFESFTELSKYKREEAAKMKAKGLARWKDEWVAEGDVPFLALGWVKDGSGAWADPVELERAKQVAQWQAAGWQFRADDNSWVAPEDFDKWREVLWKCGEQWLDTAAANEFHSKIEQAWQLVGEHFEVWTTCDWEGGNLARWYADRTHDELVRLFGVAPARKPHLFVLNGLQQYNQAAGGQPSLSESEGFSSLHGAYFADAFFDTTLKPPRYMGCGVAYWDRKDPKVSVWGPYWVRWAAAQSFVDAIDRSWLAVGQRASEPSGDVAAFAGAFWGEKRIPRWLRYGAAAYVERFMRSPDAAEGSDPWTMRAFALAELKKVGGLRKLDDVFAFALDVNRLDDSSRLYNEAGLVVAYLLDGAPGDTALAQQLEALRLALKSGTRDAAKSAALELQQALAKREADIRKFAGL